MKLELTAEEIGQLKALQDSPGMEVVAKIAKFCEAQQLEYCGTVREDQRYYQGMLQGIRLLLFEISQRASDKGRVRLEVQSY